MSASRHSPKVHGPQLCAEDGELTPLPRAGRLVLGSSPEGADLVLLGPGIDDVHCCVLKEEGGGWSLQDLGSQGGTFVNGERIDRVRLWTGDVVRLGQRELRVVDPEQASHPKAEATRTSPGQLGGFQLKRRLGAGGMGEVWLAQQESLDRPVALKLLSVALARDRAFVQRFQSEARAAAALSHPNVVIVFDVGSAEGQHYLAMEYMAGGSLEDQVAEHGPLPWREAVRAIRDCAEGLVFAEERGIVHRDVKPDNLMRSSTGSVKLADLGLATSTHGTSDAGRVLGTPHFLAPEQAKGAAPDHRADLYSLGATAFRLLTAETPFRGKTTRDILRAHQVQEPPPPSSKVADIPRALDEIVLALLAKDPDQRPQSAREVVEALDQLLENGGQGGARGRAALIVGTLVIGLVAVAAYLLFQPEQEQRTETADGGSSTPSAGGGDARATGTVESGDGGPDLLSEGGDLDPNFFDGPSAPVSIDVEQELDRRELEAQLALTALPRGLPATRELEELRSIQARYSGTPTATRLGRRIEELEADLARLQAEESGQTQALALAHEALSQAIGWPPVEGSPWDVGATLGALFATMGAGAPDDTESSAADPADPEQDDPVPSEDPSIPRARRELGQAIVARALGEFGDLSVRVEEALSDRRFDEARRWMSEAAERLRLPPSPSGLELPRLQELRDLARDVTARAEGFEDEVRTRRRAILSSDRRELALLLGPAGNLRDELKRNHWDAALGLLDDYLSRPHLPQVQARAQAFADLLRSARKALDVLVQTHAQGQWRRRNALLPLAGRNRKVEIQGLDASGLSVLDKNTESSIPWERILDQPELIQGLFQGRFTRALSSEENRSILDLLRLAAALRGAEIATRVLDSAQGRELRSREADELTELWEPARAWLETGANCLGADRARLALESEAQAGRKLKDALLAAQAQEWTSAVAQLESLLFHSADTLLVAFLSDASESDRSGSPSPANPNTRDASDGREESSER